MTLLYQDGLLLDPAGGRLVGFAHEHAADSLFGSLDPERQLLIVDCDGEWDDRGLVRFLPDGRGLAWTDGEGYHILEAEDLAELGELGALLAPALVSAA